MAKSKREPRRVYKVTFLNQGRVYEIFARQVSHGAMLGFVEVEDLVFGERTEVVVDPGEESLKLEFKGVRRTYIPVHAVIRIDEVDREGTPRISGEAKEGSKVASFPMPVFTPTQGPGGKT